MVGDAGPGVMFGPAFLAGARLKPVPIGGEGFPQSRCVTTDRQPYANLRKVLTVEKPVKRRDQLSGGSIVRPPETAASFWARLDSFLSIPASARVGD